MRPYRPVAYRQTLSPSLGQTFDQMVGISPTGGDIIRLLGHGAGAWFGLYIGMRPDMSTPLRVIGWIMGSGMALTGITDLI